MHGSVAPGAVGDAAAAGLGGDLGGDAALVVVAADLADTDRAAAALAAAGSVAAEARPVSERRVLVYGAFPATAPAVDAASRLRADGWAADVRPVGGGHLAAWQAHTRPVVVEDRLWVCFPWAELDRRDAGLVVEIDPGRGFGTGAHPSTRLLLAELVRRLRGGESVLDVGCGSGVLAIAAVMSGATRATALDIAPAALAATRANAARNGVAARLHVSTTPVADVTGRFDIVVANIGAAPLIELARAIAERLAPGGWLGLSGLSPAQVSTVAAAYRPLGVSAEVIDGEWAALVLERPGRPGHA